MVTNALPHYDANDNPTDCCPRFKPQGWDGQQLHFENKPFVRATTRSLFHVPLNMGSVFKRTFAAIEQAKAVDVEQSIVLSSDPSPWSGEHLFAVTAPVDGQDNVALSGQYLTKVFEGPYRNAPKWCQQLTDQVKATGQRTEQVYMFYTTCPKCAKHYGKNYVVAVAKLAESVEQAAAA